MISPKRALGLGLLSWAIPFVISFFAYPLHGYNTALFNGVMNLAVLLTALMLLPLYFRGRSVSVAEGLLVGALWFLINIVMDYPMFAYGPMKMTTARYYSEIGLDYLIYPLFAFGAARFALRAQPISLR